MALTNSQDRYIRLLSDGTYLVYASKADRDREKGAPKSEVIISRYVEIIDSLLADEERQYYDTEAWDEEYSGWNNERQRYLYDLQNFNTGNDYPFMEALIPGVADSIPKIIESGNLLVETRKVEMMYTLAKDRQYFGETEDV